MRSALLGTALLASVVAGCATKRATPAPVPAVSSASTPAEEAERYALATSLREQILAATRWEEPEKAPCDPGVLRTLGQSDSAAAYTRADSAVQRLEKTIITMGVDEPIDSPQGRALMRTLLTWEAGSERPNWDVPAGTKPKRVVPAGLTGEFYNVETKKCEPLSPQDTVVVIAPPIHGFTVPKIKTAHARIFYADSGLKRARDDFYSRTKGDTAAVFLYTRVSAMVLWRDFAVVAVNRPAERQAVMQLQKGAGGASYIFHRVGNEWRLLTIVRTWG